MADGERHDFAGEELLSTGEMARLSHTTLRTVRFYEAEGLLCSLDREGPSHRKFPRSELDKLRIIADLREAGLSLSEIKDLIELKQRCNTAEEAACQLSEALAVQIETLQKRVLTLQRVRGELSSTMSSIQRCKLCAHPDFPERCSDCGEIAPDRTPVTNLLWKS